MYARVSSTLQKLVIEMRTQNVHIPIADVLYVRDSVIVVLLVENLVPDIKRARSEDWRLNCSHNDIQICLS